MSCLRRLSLLLLPVFLFLTGCGEEPFPCDPTDCTGWAAHDFDGNCRCLDQWLGQQPVVVCFWSSICYPPCGEVVNGLDSLYDEYRDLGVEFIYFYLAPTVGDTAHTRFVRDKGLRGIHVFSEYHIQRLFLATNTLPVTIIFDASGKEVYRKVGYPSTGAAAYRNRLESIVDRP